MRYCAILTFLIGYCAFSFSQSLSFSRNFQASKKNLPLAIINTHPGYFFVLRYNKAAHDITIERRSKPSAEILSFIPLKLDSVNASWFDYQKLDYLSFEKNKQVCFLFEKVLNTKKTLYLKVIDTLFRSSGFIELASLEPDKAAVDFSFEYKTVGNNKILIVASQIYRQSASKKVMLYDIEKRKLLWTKKLPLENEGTGYSTSFECNENEDLFYTCIKSHIVSYQRMYINHAQVAVPVLFYDDITLVSYLNTDPVSVNRLPLLTGVSALSGIKILAGNTDVIVQAQYALRKTEEEEPDIYFLNRRCNKLLNQDVYLTVSPLDAGLKDQLTFYDGSDHKNPAEKEFVHVGQVKRGEYLYAVTERTEQNYYKELIAWKANAVNGQINKQFIIPRKLYGFKNKTRFRYGGEAVPFIYQDKVCFVIAEAPSNLAKDPAHFDFGKFKMESNPWRCNIMLYSINAQDELQKTLIHHNSDFDLIPLRYQATADAKDIVFYLSNGRYERFAIF